MKPSAIVSSFCLGLVMSFTIACNDSKVPDVTADIRHDLKAAGLNDVSVSQDREKAVVTLTGTVGSDGDKMRAESIAKSRAGNEVVADEIGIRAGGDEGTAKKVDSDLDSGIDKNLDAMLVQHKLKDNVRYSVSNGVVTLKGNVPSQSERGSVEKLAQEVPNVKQVVDELEVKHQRATSTK
jgi:hyperosmotically inducible protein